MRATHSLAGAWRYASNAIRLGDCVVGQKELGDKASLDTV